MFIFIYGFITIYKSQYIIIAIRIYYNHFLVYNYFISSCSNLEVVGSVTPLYAGVCIWK